MSEYNLYEELKKKINVEDLNSKTLSYRINGFVYACNMKLEDAGWFKCFTQNKKPYINKHEDNKDVKYSINFGLSYDNQKGKFCAIIGKYNDLEVYFINYYDEDKKKDRINEIPFHISIKKGNNNSFYKLSINTMSRSSVYFDLEKKSEKERFPNCLNFVAKNKDFSRILKLIKSFVDNPEIVFIAYNDVMSGKDIHFTKREMNAAIMEDKKLDKPTSKSAKILKKTNK